MFSRCQTEGRLPLFMLSVENFLIKLTFIDLPDLGRKKFSKFARPNNSVWIISTVVTESMEREFLNPLWDVMKPKKFFQAFWKK